MRDIDDLKKYFENIDRIKKSQKQLKEISNYLLAFALGIVVGALLVIR